MQFLLHPPRLQKALEILDTDNSGEVDEKEWCVWRRPFYHRRGYLPTWDAIDATVLVRSSPVAARRDEAIQRGLSKRLEQLAAERERRERAALRADAEFSTEFLNAARKVFQMIDDDGSGTLEKAEIVTRRQVQPARHQVPRQLRQPEPPVPAGAGAPRVGAPADGYGPRRPHR